MLISLEDKTISYHV